MDAAVVQLFAIKPEWINANPTVQIFTALIVRLQPVGPRTYVRILADIASKLCWGSPSSLTTDRVLAVHWVRRQWRARQSPMAIRLSSSPCRCCAWRILQQPESSHRFPLSLAYLATPSVWQCRTDSPYRSFNDYIAAARRKSRQDRLWLDRHWFIPHLLMEEVGREDRVSLNHVPFKGDADLQQALLGGHLAAWCLWLGASRGKRQDAPCHLR